MTNCLPPNISNCLNICQQLVAFSDRTVTDLIVCPQTNTSTKINNWSGIPTINYGCVEYCDGYFKIPQTGLYTINISVSISNIVNLVPYITPEGCCSKTFEPLNVVLQLFSRTHPGKCTLLLDDNHKKNDYSSSPKNNETITTILAKSYTPIISIGQNGLPVSVVTATLSATNIKLCQGQKIAVAVSQNSKYVGNLQSGATISVVRNC